MTPALTPAEIADTTTDQGLTRMGICPTCRGHHRVRRDHTTARHTRGTTRSEWLDTGRTSHTAPCEGGTVATLTVGDSSPSGPYVVSDRGRDVFEVHDTRFPEAGFSRVVRTPSGGPATWADQADAVEAAENLWEAELGGHRVSGDRI